MPPGPFPWPIIGNVGQIPASKPWLTFEKWAKDYNSPLITIWTGVVPTVIANDRGSASDLMDKRANIYSSRPHMVLVGDMFDETTTNQTSLVYGDQWRTHRRIMHTAVGAQAVKNYRVFQGNESRLLARDLLQKADFVDAIERYAVSVVTIIGWGRRIQSTKDPLAQMALSFVQNGASFASPGQFLVESYPWMVRLPKFIWPLPHVLWEEGQRLQKYFYALSVEGSQSTHGNFSKRLISAQEEQGLNYKEVASLSGNLIGGGVDTTTTSTIVFLFAMCRFPEVQKKAQEEIDRVLGDDCRFPTWTEEDKLPYCSALVKEVFRWRPAIPLGGPPHAPTQDDVYNNMLIPRGTTLIGNVWAIHRNPHDYPDPDNFRPERFLQQDDSAKKNVFTFGWGRRQCSGQPLAEQGIWFTVVELLWAFNMRSVDDQGNDRLLDVFDFNDASTSRPNPFKVEFKPRSEKHRELIMQEGATAERELAQYNISTKITPEQF